MGMPGGGPPGESLTKMKTLSTAEKNARKAARKREKDARQEEPALSLRTVLDPRRRC